MWNVRLVNNIGDTIDERYFEVEELTLDDISGINWCLADGDSIVITKLGD